MKLLKLFKNIFNRTNIEYNQIINSDKYFESKWRIRYLDSIKSYVIYDRNEDKYLDLVNGNYKWRVEDKFFKDCSTSSKREIINKFKDVLLLPSISKIDDETILNEIDIKVIEKYLRKKKLNKANDGRR